MESVYHKLFEVRLWHDYFLPDLTIPLDNLPATYDIREFITVKPTEESRKLLAKHRLLFRQTNTGFQVISETIERIINGTKEYETLIPLRDKVKWTFIVTIVDPYLLQYTNLPLRAQSASIYYVDNLVQNDLNLSLQSGAAPQQVLFLTKPIEDYDTRSDEDLLIGDMVRELQIPGEDNSGMVYEVIDLPITMAPVAGQTDEWATAKNSQYLTEKDSIPALGNSLRIARANAPDLAGKEVLFEVKDIYQEPAQLGIRLRTDEEEFRYEEARFPDNQATGLEHELSFRDLPTGRYTIDWDVTLPPGEDSLFPLEFYHIDPKEFNAPFATIEIHSIEPKAGNLVEVPADYQFVEFMKTTPNTPNEPIRNITIIKDKIYNIHLRNRSTCWEFRAQENRDQLLFEIEKPVALTRQYKEFTVEDTGSDLFGKVLPNPPVRSVKTKRVKDDFNNIEYTKYISTTFL